jgi:hypothetical protein
MRLVWYPTQTDLPPTERRRWPRQQVAWRVILSIDGGTTLTGTALDASLHGLRVSVCDTIDSPTIIAGAQCQVEVHLAGGQARFVRSGEVRHFGAHGIGLLIAKPLPLVVQPELGDRSSSAPDNAMTDPSTVIAMLRSAAATPLYR